MREEKESAFHEAAHGLVAWYLGAKINAITIIGPVEEHLPREEKTPCYCDVQAPGMVPLQRLTEEDIIFRMLVSLAPYALEKIRGKNPSFGARCDISNFLHFITWGRENGSEVGKICRIAQSILGRYPKNLERQADEFFDHFGGLAISLLSEPNSFKRVEALAGEVLRKGRLTGHEAVKILERTGENSLPERARPASEHNCGLIGVNPETALEAAKRLCNMVLAILTDSAAVLEDKLCEEARKAVLQSLFVLEEITSASGQSASDQAQRTMES